MGNEQREENEASNRRNGLFQLFFWIAMILSLPLIILFGNPADIRNDAPSLRFGLLLFVVVLSALWLLRFKQNPTFKKLVFRTWPYYLVFSGGVVFLANVSASFDLMSRMTNYNNKIITGLWALVNLVYLILARKRFMSRTRYKVMVVITILLFWSQSSVL